MLKCIYNMHNQIVDTSMFILSHRSSKMVKWELIYQVRQLVEKRYLSLKCKITSLAFQRPFVLWAVIIYFFCSFFYMIFFMFTWGLYTINVSESVSQSFHFFSAHDRGHYIVHTVLPPTHVVSISKVLAPIDFGHDTPTHAPTLRG